MTYPFKDYLKWSKLVIPTILKKKPIHNWFVFRHSFSDDLVRILTREWKLNKKDKILDPFVGAGTTVVTAKELNVPSTGCDLSPLSVFFSKTKSSSYHVKRLSENWIKLKKSLSISSEDSYRDQYSDLLNKALPGRFLSTFHYTKEKIFDLNIEDEEKNFFLSGLISIISEYSRAVSSGGWLKWRKNTRDIRTFPSRFSEKINSMIEDLKKSTWSQNISILCNIKQEDCRLLSSSDGEFSAVITSPPYPNRHDYTRVFGVELMFGFTNWKQTRSLRYQTIESHPEAKPKRPNFKQYAEPTFITDAIAEISYRSNNNRIKKMLHGYFIDMYLCLKEISRVLISGGKCAFVVGNAQYDGIPIEVDKSIAEIGRQVGLKVDEIRIVRIRNNSAQQIKIYGKKPSRESIVIFSKV